MPSKSNEPLVSVVTPLYNGEKYLQEGIESVINQQYTNWQYTIVNNCSTDGSLEIAQQYAAQDNRIRIVNTQKTIPMVDNFNFSMRQISAQSEYCKVLHADDLLMPTCLSEMVALAENNPTVGIVGAYVLEGVRIKCDGLPLFDSVFSGRDICRWSLLDTSLVLGGLYVFGSPTSLLIRSDLVRRRDPFYNSKYLQVVDQEACYHLLQHCDFGFVHQVLTYSRLHEASTTSSGSGLNRLILESLMLLAEFGPVYLSPDEYAQRKEARLQQYYRFLAQCRMHRKNDRELWRFHTQGLAPVSYTHLTLPTN